MNKLRFLFMIFCFCFLAIIVRLFFIQIVFSSSYSADYTTTRKISPNRGKILDRNHEPIAINQTKYLVYVEPKKMKSKFKLIEKLDEVLKIGESTLEARINEKKDWVAITGNVSKESKIKLESLLLPELGFQEETHRFYPEASLAAHLIGFMGKDKDGEGLGYFGVEGYYDKDLAGLPGVLKSERDLFNRPIFVGSQEKVDAADGRDFVLTIDKSVQHIVKEHLKAGVEQFKAKSGCVIAVKPKTMEIIALTCLPDFDPDTYYDFSNDVFSNWSISSAYEPGSTFKPLIMAAAIEEGVLKPTDTFNETGAVTIGGYRIQNWNDKYEGKISITRILEKSSNVGMVYVGQKLGKQKVYDYIKKYGFGDYTNIDLQGETPGQLKPLDSWYPIDAATMPFGQGISVTAMQLVRGFAAVINGGYLMRPYIVKEVVEDGYKKVREPQIQRRVLSEKTSRIMRKMLVDTVAHAEAKWDIPEGFTFGGKTGTAQIALEGKYDASKTIASFIGFVPADDPEFLVLTVIQEPGSSSWGSETAAPLFFDIAKELLIYYNIPAEN
jgi:cell division protein FtsI/penicillin-binding protein 2